MSVKFTYLSGREVNVSLMDLDDPLARKERSWLNAWLSSGTRHMTYYPYTQGAAWQMNLPDCQTSAAS